MSATAVRAQFVLIDYLKLGNINKKLSYRRDSARCVKQEFKVTQGHPLYQSTRHIWLPISTQ